MPTFELFTGSLNKFDEYYEKGVSTGCDNSLVLPDANPERHTILMLT